MPVPPDRPCADRDDYILPVRGLSHFWGATAAGVKPRERLCLFLGITPEPFFVYFSAFTQPNNASI